jgi:hypothetical protein
MKRLLSALLVCTLTLASSPAAPRKGVTLADLKKLDITVLVPGWLPEGYRLKEANIDKTDAENGQVYPGYNLEYSNRKKGSFTLESARWGIGDRNLDQNDRAEESQFQTKAYGPVYIIYFPPGKTGVKKRITANWIRDENMKSELAKKKDALAIKGRFHGFSGFGMTVAEFQKIVQSLHPISEKYPISLQEARAQDR